MSDHLLKSIGARRGHFALESGHHADLWFDLESLCLQPARIRPLAARIAARLGPYDVDMVCGPLVEGAYVGLMAAEELGVEFICARPASRFKDSVTRTTEERRIQRLLFLLWLLALAVLGFEIELRIVRRVQRAEFLEPLPSGL